MLCPSCKKSNTKVLDSRDEKVFVKRRRQCLSCKYRFTTHEKIESPKIKVIKRDGQKEDYYRGKLARGIYRALEKRPFSKQQIEMMISDIEHKITKIPQREIASKKIGDYATETLKQYDDVAFLRFLSVYKKFGSAKKFRREVDKLL